MNQQPQYPPGDVVPAERVLESIAQMRWREQLQDRELCFVIEGSATLLALEAAADWIRRSAAEGYDQIRYFLADDDGRRIVLQLAAFAPLEPAEDDE